MRWRPWTITGLVALTGCWLEPLPAPEQVKSDIERHLKPGDPHTAVEKALKGQKLGFSYDKYANRYQSIIRQRHSNFKAVVIHVYLDEQRRFLRVETRNSYTSP